MVADAGFVGASFAGAGFADGATCGALAERVECGGLFGAGDAAMGVVDTGVVDSGVAGVVDTGVLDRGAADETGTLGVDTTGVAARATVVGAGADATRASTAADALPGIAPRVSRKA